jgi:hypothetical protein
MTAVAGLKDYVSGASATIDLELTIDELVILQTITN